MITFEKGLTYNFIIERIAEVKGNYYYVIQVDHKECWIRMYPFEIYQGSKKNIIRCEYRGTDSFGSHIFIEDKLSILYELYEENKEYDFNYVKESIDTEGKLFAVLKDKYGLTHRLYEPLTPDQKDKKRSIKCSVTSFNKTSKMLTLHLISANANSPIADSATNRNTTNTEWMDAETLFKTIGKEYLLNEFFYEVQNAKVYGRCKSNFIELYQERNKKWIEQYLIYLDRNYKYILIQSENLEKLSEFADLMIELIHQIAACQSKQTVKKLPKLSKYEGLKKAIDILLIGSLNDYHKKISQIEEPLSEMNTLLALFEADKDFFGNHFPLYKESVQMLYNNINQMNIPDTFHQSRQDKCLRAFRGILSYKLKVERERLIENILGSSPSSTGFNSYTFSKLYTLLQQSNYIDNQSILSCMDMRPAILGEMACLIYGSKLLRNTEDSGRLLTSINNMNYISTLCEESDMKEIEKVKIEEDIEEDEEKNTTSETNIFLNVYDDRTYVISVNPTDEYNIIKSIAINPSKDKFILQCYEHGSINKVAVRFLLEKKREKRYLNGLYSQDQLKEIFAVSEETYLAAVSSYNQEKFIKLYSTKCISEHTSLGLKGNQVVGANVDSTEYFLIPSEYTNLLPQRLIYDSATPIGKNIKNSYYENDIQILKEIGRYMLNCFK